MELVTGRKGVAHITSQQDRMKHQGMFGEGAYILETGQMLEPQVQTSNEIRIRDGALMVQGALSCVKTNSYDAVTIQNGTQGMKRIDLICWQYTYDAEQDVESAEWVVIQGTPAESDPQQPSYTDGDIQQGDSPVQVPVFAVELDGINVTGVTTLVQTAPSLEKLNGKIQSRTPQIISGTKVIRDINNVTAVVLFTLSELQSAFKAFDAEKECFACSITNGDENASSNHFDGTTWKGTDLMALFNDRETGDARFNYIVAYNPDPDDAI